MSDSSTEGYEVPQSKLVSKIGGIVFTILAIGAILFFLRGGDDDPSDQTSQPIERQYSLNQTWFAPPSEQLDHFEGV